MDTPPRDSETSTDAGIPQEPAAVPPRVDLDGPAVLLYRGIPVGELDGDGTLTVELGWCRLAGLGVLVHDDPSVDRHRDGVALARGITGTAA